MMDSEPEERFDRICRIASQLMGTPVAYVSLLDDKKQFYKAAVGLGGMTETTLDDSFCLHTVQLEQTVYVPDATKDERFKNNKFVTGPPNVRCYLGEPLFSPDGYAVGTFCVIDLEPKELNPLLKELCRDLAALAERELNLISQLYLQEKLTEFTSRLTHCLDITQVGSVLLEVLHEYVASDFSSVSLSEGRQMRVAARQGEESAHPSSIRLEIPGFFPGELFLSRRGREYSQQERGLLEAFCSQTGLLLENRHSLANLVEQSRLASLGTLAAGVAHELNSPLGAARLNLEAVRKALEPHQEKLGKKLERTTRALSKADIIIDSVLCYAGESPELSCSTRLNEAVRKVASLLERDLREGSVELKLELGSEARVSLESEKVHRVVHQLLDNACKALADCPGDCKTITISTSCSGEEAVITVEDTGPGVPLEHRERIFDPFFTLRGPGHGVGLGLATSRQVLRRAGGDLVLMSSPRGAAFRATIPCC